MLRLTSLLMLALLAIGSIFVIGCDDPFKVSTEDEIEIGSSAGKSLEKEYGLWKDETQTRRVQRIGDRIAADTTRADLPWSFKLLNTKDVNAMAAPGGYIYVTRGLLEEVTSDDELAGVVGHEIAHVVKRHGAKMIEKQTKIALAAGVLLGEQSDAVVLGASIANALVMSGYSREDEYTADKYGTVYASQSGYKADGLLRFLRTLESLEEGSPSTLERWIATHPPTKDRIKKLEQQLGI